MTTFTDAERAFADSAEGVMMIARAKSDHRMREAYKGSNAIPWTDAKEASAIRELTTERARERVQSTASLADSARQVPALRAAADTARAMRKAEVSSAYRNGR